jgi:PAS domain S-box-containing protein
MPRKKADKLVKAPAKGRAKAPVERVRARTRTEVDRARRARWLASELKTYREQARAQGEQLLEIQAFLEESRNRYADLYDFAPVAYVTLNHNGLVEEINLTGAQLLGTPRSSVVGLPLLIFVDPADRTRFLDHLYRCRTSGPLETLTTELQLKPHPVEMRIPVQLITRVARGAELTSYRTAILDRTEQREAEQKVLGFRQRLTSLASELVKAEERERRRIAVEVHDNLSQSLVLAKMKLGALRKKASGDGSTGLCEGIEDVTALVDEVLQQTRTLTFDLSPPILYELGFEAALEWLGERIGQRHKLAVRVEARRRMTGLPEDTAVLLFQCVRELLTNTAKHAEATRAVVRVRRSHHTVRVTVEDNGRGFDPQQPRADGAGGFGLFSVTARLEHVGGRMDIDAVPGGPTKVSLTIPVPGV